MLPALSKIRDASLARAFDVGMQAFGHQNTENIDGGLFKQFEKLLEI